MVETTEVEDNATNFEENTIPSKISTETTDVMEDGTNKAPIEIPEAGILPLTTGMVQILHLKMMQEVYHNARYAWLSSL